MREDLTPEQRAIIARCRSRFAYIDSLVEPQRSLAIYAVPESQWPEVIRWSTEAAGLIRGTLHRVWRKDHWVTEKAPAVSRRPSR